MQLNNGLLNTYWLGQNMFILQILILNAAEPILLTGLYGDNLFNLLEVPFHRTTVVA